MSYNATNHRRNLSVPSPKTPLDPNPSSGSATVQQISTHFSRLYLNHKARSFLTPSSTHPPQSESTAVSTLTKSQSQRTTRKPRYINEEPEPEPQEESIKKAIIISSKEPTKNVNLVPEKGGIRKLQGDEVKGKSLGLIGIDRGKRWPFGFRSQVEVADFLAFNGVKVVSSDMPPFMQIHAVDITRKTYDSMEKFTAKTLALTLKKEFDGVYGPAWHCIVGLSFGSYVTHSVGGFLYFSMDQKLFVLLFKTAIARGTR